ncbi:hypothetical protein BY996DRAFT_6441095 [Phakopsora pachyrhizi]|nr:hypothetical protein BY996DRAFT_6441095 [Phakopsora pachyrhizi]
MKNTTQDINAINSNSKAFAIPQYSTYDPVSNTISPREIISPSVISKNSSPNFNGGTSPNVDLVSAQALTAEIIRVPEDSQTASAPNEETNKHPSSTEPWFKPEIIDFDLLESFNNHENTLQPKDYISITAKSSHPETNLVRFLYSLRFTSQTSIQSWARIVAASIETVADELHQPAAPKAHKPISNLNAHLETIKWLESFKKDKLTTAIEGFGALENSTSRELKKELQDFYNVIIDVMISYSIFQAQAHVEYEEKIKKKNSNSIRKYSSTKNNSLGAAHQKLNAY